MTDSWQPHGLQHTRLLCPSLSSRVCSNLCPLSWRCYLTISPSAAPFSLCLPSFLISGSFPANQLFASGGQSITASVTTSVLLCSDFFIVQLSHLYMTTGKTKVLTRQTFVGKVMPLLLMCCLGYVISSP